MALPTTASKTDTGRLLQRPPRQLAIDLGSATTLDVVVPSDPLVRKSELGQFWTPAHVADFMASLFTFSPSASVEVLDPGAGGGALTSAFVRAAIQSNRSGEVRAVAYEVDGHLVPCLHRNLSECGIAFSIEQEDFVERGVRLVAEGKRPFTHVIMNPPYKKMNSKSEHRRLLMSVGIQTVNLYSAFMTLAIELLQPGGQLVAIVPRSFCNGPYYRPLRQQILRSTAIRHIHLFAARDRAFRDDAVLQENVIIRLDRDRPQGNVTVSTSTDDRMGDFEARDVDFSQIVLPGDDELFIHIPTNVVDASYGRFAGLNHSLAQLNVDVSTGPVVDFRLRAHLTHEPNDGGAPLLYPLHLQAGSVTWPIAGAKKPNGIAVNNDTRKWLFPIGDYTVAKRFSSKEERRRIVATPVRAESFAHAEWIGFENHLNVFHRKKRGLPLDLCHGLAALLNSTPFDDLFRRFNGHTQVNATDLRTMKYPAEQVIRELGEWALDHPGHSQEELDAIVMRAIS